MEFEFFQWSIEHFMNIHYFEKNILIRSTIILQNDLVCIESS